MKPTLKAEIRRTLSLFEPYLNSITLWETWPKQLASAARYSLFGGGKRVRPCLALLTAEALGGRMEDALPWAAAVEMIHTYSLIHDDLPAMDDDDYRRGKLSCHKKFSEATAILAGDAIQPLSLEILTSIQDENLSEASKCKIINIFAKACGPKGMVEGQHLDLKAENKNLSEKELNEIHYLKTGKLIEACIVAVCVLKKDITDEEISKLVKFAQKFGLAFQIRDDILDVIGEEKDIGKPVGSDESKNKSTYASILGVPKSQEKAEKLSQEAINILKSLPYNTQKLQNLSNLIVERIR